MTELTPHDLVRIAARAGCDPRTARKVLAPAGEGERERIRSTTAARVRDAAIDLGYLPRPMLPNGPAICAPVSR